MSEIGFPPPKPPTGRSLEFEKEKQAEFCALEEAGKLPVDSEGKSLDFVGFMELAEEERKAPEPMVREELSGGANVRVARHLNDTERERGKKTAKKPAVDKLKSKERKTVPSAAVAREVAHVDETLKERIEELHNLQLGIEDRAAELTSVIESKLGGIANPSDFVRGGNAAYQEAKRKSDDIRLKLKESLEEATQNPSRASRDAYASRLEDLALSFEQEEHRARELLSLPELSLGASPRPGNRDATPSELRKALRASIVEASLRESENELGSKSTEGVREGGIEEVYLKAVRERYKNKGLLEKVAGDYIDTDARFESKHIKSLRTQWIASQARLASAQRESAEKRLEANPSAARDALLQRLREKHGALNVGKTDILDRYERMVTRNSVIVEAEKAELSAKEEGLGERDKKALEKMLDRYKTLPPGVRIIGTSALLFGGAALAAGTPLGWAALGLGGASAGLRWAAEVVKNPAMKNSLAFLTGLTSVASLSGILAQKAVEGSHRLLGTEKKAVQTLEKTKGLGPLDSARNLERTLDARRNALKAKETMQRQGRIARILGSITGGFLFGSAVHDANRPEGAVGNEVEAQAPRPADGAESPVAAGRVVEVDATHAQTAPEVIPQVYVTPVVPEGMLRTMEIGKGEGFNHLFSDLRQSEFTGSTPVGTYLANGELTPTQLSDAIGAFDPVTGESMRMEVGDTLIVDAKENVWFVREGEAPRLILENNPSAPNGIAIHEFTSAEVTTSVPVAEVAPTEEPVITTVSETPTPETVPTETSEVRTVPVERSFEHQVMDPVVPGDVRPLDARVPEVVPQASTAAESQTVQTTSSEPESTRIETSVTQNAEVPASFTNAHDVRIDPSIPKAYATLNPDGSETFSIYGGTGNEPFYAAQQYAATHPGATVRFEAVNIDPITNEETRYTGSFVNVGEGRAMPVMGGEPVLPPNPETFTRPLDYIYRSSTR